ncbi:hypothetical protein SISNIDRAFT_279975 [Sistotremastrum niveocremeum HHB9708]|uniref:Uncharacterized protein n=1 Tax=Sistotremastrum niveocremeum HHB9708 TaxID=1314777 RepID=A0A164NR73_9AGAM|nr:hypothetical protein SISNIDRAFT_279975 [Sistotremastrum niveocremeum HHB9708]
MGHQTHHMQYPTDPSTSQYNAIPGPSSVAENWHAGYGVSAYASGHHQEVAQNSVQEIEGWNGVLSSGLNIQQPPAVNSKPNTRNKNREPEIPALVHAHSNERPEASLALTTIQEPPLADSPFQNIFSSQQCLLHHTTNICPHFLPRIVLRDQLPRRSDYGLSESILRDLLIKFDDVSFFPPNLLGFDVHVYRASIP